MAVDIAARLVIRDVEFGSKAQDQIKNLRVPKLKGAKQINKNLREISTTLTAIQQAGELSATSIDKTTKAQDRAAASSKKANKALRESASAAGAFADQSALALRRFTAFSVAAGGVFGTLRSVTEGLKEAISFERELVRIAQVSDKSLQEVERGLGRTIGTIAKTFGTSAQELNKVGLIFAQSQGSIEGVDKALEAIAKSSLAPTFDSISQTAEGSVAIFRQFNLETNKLEAALSRVNTVSGKFAVESGDIFRAVQKAGGVFAQASEGSGTAISQLEEFIGVFTAVRSTTRESADTIATGLRTIFTRIQRPSTIAFLKDLGINLENSQGQFVGAFEAVKRLSTGLKDLSGTDLRRALILEEIGGFRQFSRATALTSQRGFQAAQEAIKLQREASDSLEQDVNQALQTLGVQLAQTGERLADLFRGITNTASFEFLAKSFLNLSNSIISVLEAGKELLPVLTAIAAVRLASSFTFGGGAAAFGTRLFTGRGLPRRQKGGVVPGIGPGDKQQILAEAGEFVIRKSAARALGLETLSALNQADKFRTGGMVGSRKKFQLGGLIPTGGSNNLSGDASFREGAEIFIQEGKKLGGATSQLVSVVNEVARSFVTVDGALDSLDKRLRSKNFLPNDLKGGGTNSGGLTGLDPQRTLEDNVARQLKQRRFDEQLAPSREINARTRRGLSALEQTEDDIKRGQNLASDPDDNKAEFDREQRRARSERLSEERRVRTERSNRARRLNAIRRSRQIDRSLRQGTFDLNSNEILDPRIARQQQSRSSSPVLDRLRSIEANRAINARTAQGLARQNSRIQNGAVSSSDFIPIEEFDRGREEVGRARRDELSRNRAARRRRRNTRFRNRIRTVFRNPNGPFIPPGGGGGGGGGDNPPPRGPRRDISSRVRSFGANLSNVGGAGLLFASSQFDRQTASSGAAGGGFAGAGTGALLGSSAGPVGAAVGGIAGALIGGINGLFEGQLNDATNTTAESLSKLTAAVTAFDAKLKDGSATINDFREVLSKANVNSRDLEKEQSLRGRNITTEAAGSTAFNRIAEGLIGFASFNPAAIGRAATDDTDFSFNKQENQLLEQSGEFTFLDRLKEFIAFDTPFGTEEGRRETTRNRIDIRERQQRRNDLERADNNKPVAQQARDFLAQQVRSGAITDARDSNIGRDVLVASVSDTLEGVRSAPAAAEEQARRALIDIIKREQALLADNQAQNEFTGALARMTIAAERTRDILSLFSQELAAGAAAQNNIVSRSQGNFRSQVGGRVNPFNNLGIASLEEIESAIGQLETFSGRSISDDQRGALAANVGIRTLPELLRQSTSSGALSAESSTSNFKAAVASAFSDSNNPLSKLPDEIKNSLGQIATNINVEDVTAFQRSGQLPAALQELQKVVEQNNQAFKELYDGQNEFQDAVATAGNQLTELIGQRNSLRSQAFGAAAGAERTRRDLFGGQTSIQEGINFDTASVRGLTGGLTDPTQIANRIQQNNATIRDLRSQAGGLSAEGLIDNQGERSELNAENEALQRALGELGQKITGLTTIQEKLAQIEQKRAAQRSAAFGLAFGGPEETRRQARGQAALNLALRGGRGALASAGLNNEDLRAGFEARSAQIVDPEQRDAFEANLLKQLGFTGSVTQTSREGAEFKNLEKVFDKQAKLQQEALAGLQGINENNINNFRDVVVENFANNITRFQDAVENLNIPESIQMDVKHSDINLNFNGVEVFRSLTPEIEKIAKETVERAINNMQK